MRRYLQYAILVGVILLLAVVPTSAEQGIGSSPYVARILSTGLNIGEVAPNEAFWYSFSSGDLGRGAVGSVILDMVFKPGDLRTAARVKFDVYTFDQVNTMVENDRPVTKVGFGQLTTSDFDQNSSERLWAGAVEKNQIYYVYIENKSEVPVDYHLNVLPQQQVMSVTPVADPTNAIASINPAGVVGDALASSSASAVPINDPNSPWLLAVQAVQNMPADQAAAWLKNATELGWLSNGAGSTNAGVSAAITPEGEKPAPEVAAAPIDPVPEDPNIYPTEPLILTNRNVGRLAPSAEHWFTFLKDDLDEHLFEEMSLTLFHTPGEGNIANKVNFELFTGDQYHIWERGTPDAMTNFGSGGQVSRDNDPMTGERVWKGSIVDGDKYFIRIRNDAAVWVDYYLIVGDIENTELGDSPNTQRANLSSAAARDVYKIDVDVPLGTDIMNPLSARTGHNQGRLSAGDDRWYVFRYQNFEQAEPEFRRYGMVLKHTPGLGHVANHVNVEIYSHPQRALWLRGDGDQMKPLGVGSRELYHRKTNTQEFVWDGHLVSDAYYFVRVRNDSDESIFFDLDIFRK
ncbi:MAG: hypothetical protein AAF629_18730 [Chloroflexota bacterium]